jgi:glycosyltransferase involved in cell wall biosynthesis
VERLAEQTALALIERGHEVTVLTRGVLTEPPVPRLERIEQDGARVFMVPGGGPQLGRFPRLTPTLERVFEIALLETNPDVVLVSNLVDHSPSYPSIARRWGVPVVMELHDFFTVCERAHLERVSGELCHGPEGGRACAEHCYGVHDRGLERWALRTHLYRRALEQADALVCPSEFVAGYFHEAIGPNLPPLHVIGNGVDFSCSRRADAPQDAGGPLHIACVGAVAAHKGIHVVLEAIRLSRIERVRLTLIGNVNPRYYRQIVAKSERLENLELRALGRFAPRELPLLLADVDAVVIASLVWETYSIAAREALACGVPVVASRLGAIPEAIRHGHNGLLFEPGSPLDLAAILETLDRDPDQLRNLRAGIRPTDWISVGERTSSLLEVLEAVVAGGGRESAVAHELEELSILRDGLLEAM